VASVVLPPNLKRHVERPTETVAGATVGAVPEAVFAGNRPLRGYVVDDQGGLRRRVSELAVVSNHLPPVDAVKFVS